MAKRVKIIQYRCWLKASDKLDIWVFIWLNFRMRVISLIILFSDLLIRPVCISDLTENSEAFPLDVIQQLVKENTTKLKLLDSLLQENTSRFKVVQAVLVGRITQEVNQDVKERPSSYHRTSN